MNNKLSLAIFIVAVVAAGSVIGGLTAPGDWYAGLTKPSFNPPGWIFAPVWTVLYVLIAIAGWRAWRINRGGPLMAFWIIQMILNLSWSPIFFAARNMDMALVVIAALLAVIIAFIAVAWKPDRTSAWLFMPYAAWVAFAAVLNLSIVGLN